MERLDIEEMNLTEEKLEAFKLLANDFTTSGGLIFFYLDQNGDIKVRSPYVELKTTKSNAVNVNVCGYRGNGYSHTKMSYSYDTFCDMTYDDLRNSIEAIGEFDVA